MTMYGADVLGAAAASFVHVATPSCIAVDSAGSHQVVTGAYDGVVRLWDLRSVKSALASFKAWEGIVGVGGEGELEVWKVGEEQL